MIRLLLIASMMFAGHGSGIVTRVQQAPVYPALFPAGMFLCKIVVKDLDGEKYKLYPFVKGDEQSTCQEGGVEYPCCSTPVGSHVHYVKQSKPHSPKRGLLINLDCCNYRD